MSVNRRIFGLASSVLVFAGMAFGAPALNNCVTQTTVPVNSLVLRSEGAAELVSDLVMTCDGTTSALTGSVYATISNAGPLLSITSRTVGGVNEATLQIMDNSGGGNPTIFVPGTVNAGSGTVTFSPVTFPLYNFKMEISNIRVNATPAAQNTVVNEQIVAIAQGVALIQQIPVQVGLVRQGLSAPTVTGLNNFLVCNGGGLAFTVNVAEMFAGAFKSQHAPTAANSPDITTVPPASPANIPGGEDGSYIAGAIGAATSGTRIKLVFSTIPTNVTLSVPVTVNTAGKLYLALQGGTETGAFSIAGSGTLTASNGVATAIYEVREADVTSVSSIGIQVTATFTANTVQAPAGPITVVTSYAPSPSAPGGAIPAALPSIPYFANTGTSLNGSVFSACQTTLLFPFVTNEAGFETGIVIANAGMDNLKVGGGSQAAGQPGACTIRFYGSTGAEGGAQPTAPVAANFPAPAATPATIAPGTTHADTLTDVVGGPFQGYAIAVCPFLYAKGFAYIEYGLTTNAGVSEGYLADIIGSDRMSNIAAPVAVSNTTPEVSGQ